MSGITNSPPRAPPIKYDAPLGTRWAKEKAAAGGANAFDLPSDPKSIGPWILGECVGKGASGRVKIAKHRRTGQLAAVKILPIGPLVNSRNSLTTQNGKPDKYRLGVDREITMMKLMKHPNIMRIYDVFEGEQELFLVLEYVEGGELFDFLVNRGRLPPQEALEYFKQIVYGLNYAHTFSIIHRDLKPENILIASLSPPLIKIADWGMAAFAPPTLQLETSCGSPHYASPEIVNGEKYQGNATDIWSCGVILYALLTGRLPFDDKNVRILLSKVKSGKYEMPTWIDPLAKDLLGRMLIVDVTKRITIPEILTHPWLTASTSATLPTSGKLLCPVTPSLPPSPSTLARPIASPSLIDFELFSSLRIIWGRHADDGGELIRRELCSPAGHGVHTKAFYYLLNRYREESDRKRLDDGEDLDESSEFNGIRRLRFDHGWASLLNRKTNAPELARQDRCSDFGFSTSRRARTMSSPIHASGVMRKQPAVLSSPMDRACNRPIPRERPASPFGPRPLPSPQHAPCRVVEYHSRCPVSVHPGTPTGVLAMGPRAQPARRGYTFSHPTDKQINFEARPVDARISVRPNEERYKHPPLSASPIERKRTNVGPHIAGYSKLDVQKRTSHISRTSGEADKENRTATIPSTGRRASGVGLGMGLNNVREVGEEMGNVVYIGTGNTPAGKSKERKRKLTALDSPIALSPPVTGANNTGSPARLLTSPVVGEFKGWFSSLFNWKSGGNLNGSGNNNAIVYSPDDLHKTCGAVANLLESFGVIVLLDSSVDPNNADQDDSPAVRRLKCRVEELSVDAQANISLKPVRFRVEFTPTRPPRPLTRQSFWSPPLSPITDNTSFFLPQPTQDDVVTHVNVNHTSLSIPSAPNPGLTPRVRTSMLPVIMRVPSGQNTPVQSPGLNDVLSATLDSRQPCGGMCGILLVYEKGSTSSFKTIWKKVKEYYCDSPTKARTFLAPESYGAFSPLMASTPVSQACPTGQFVAG
ncbi:Pkinase domain containing protein [Amanita muscaria]